MSDPFAVLGIEPRFDLDLQALHQRFIAAAAVTHPDRYLDPLEQSEAAARTAEINEAYATLCDPERRANALLLVQGGPAPEDDKSLPPDFLMEMMEVREEMEQAVDKDDEAELRRLRHWADQQRRGHLEQIKTLFAAEDAQAVRHELNALRYIERMLEQMPAPQDHPSASDDAKA